MFNVCIISRNGKRACILLLPVIKRAGEYWAECNNTQYRVHACDCPCYDYLGGKRLQTAVYGSKSARAWWMRRFWAWLKS